MRAFYFFHESLIYLYVCDTIYKEKFCFAKKAKGYTKCAKLKLFVP